MSYEVPLGITVSHFAVGHDIPTPRLMIRNGLEYPEQLKAGTVFHVYHPGIRGVAENVYDGANRILGKY